MKLLLVNGPNLNTLGTREPAIYGTTTLEQVIARFHEVAGPGHQVVDMQSNHEGALIDFLQRHADADGCVINPGGLAHTSIVLRDAVAGCAFPVVEVHISDIGKREPFRHHTYLADVTAHQVIGKGVAGYEEAVNWLLQNASTARKQRS
ncbi:MAG TPA: type II 3-dehydroquinate dehydratase [Candidatus Limnocylindria bacterium]|jgi:3-dehydroquinate dehydratase-2